MDACQARYDMEFRTLLSQPCLTDSAAKDVLGSPEPARASGFFENVFIQKQSD